MRNTMVLLGLMGLLVAGASAQQKPQDAALQAAIRAETVAGDLKGAIAQYQTIVDRYYKTDRAVVASALVRMAECHQKLGNEQATKLFERVLREFADQKQAVDVASARLGRSKSAVAGMMNRQVWSGRDVDSLGTTSLDGRYLSFVDWDSGDLAMREISTGTNRRLTNKGSWADSDDFAEESTISRDGAQVAYGWFNSKTSRYEVRIIRSDAAAGVTPRTVFDNPDVSWVAPYDWSPDGKWLAIQLTKKDRTAQIGFVSTADGSYKPLKSIDWRGTTRMFFSPDGAMLSYDLFAPDNVDGRDVFVLRTDGSREFTVAPHRGHEMAMGWSPDGKLLLFASDRAGSMGLWSVPVANGEPGAMPTLIKADLGHVMESLGVSRSGSLLYGVRTSAATIATAALDLESGKLLSAPTLPFENYLSAVRQPDWSPDGKLIVAVSEVSRRRSGLTIRTADGARVRDLATGMGHLQRPRWAPDGSITVQGLDLKGRQGIYRIDAQTGEVSVIVQGVSPANLGQPSWLPDGKSLVFRRNQPDKITVVWRNIASGEERVLIERPDIRGVSVSPDGQQISYIIADRATRTTTLNTMPIHGGPSREIVQLPGTGLLRNMTVWTPDGRSLFFGKFENDKSSLWIVPSGGGTPRKLDIVVGDTTFLRIHPDGRRIAYDTGVQAQELWMLERFLPPATKSGTKP